MNKERAARKRILIAEDSAEIGKRLVELLSDLTQVEIIGPAANGDEALRLFKQSSPHGAVLDLQMPGLTGVQVLVAIRKEDKNCLVIILTNNGGEEVRKHCLEAGADFYLQKSTEFERVREIVQACVENRL